LELLEVNTAVTLESKKVLPQQNEGDLPSFFNCPLTKQLLQDPVVLRDGVSYERQAVADRNEAVMYPNRALKAILSECVASSGTSTAATTSSNSVPNASTVIPRPSLFQQAKRFFAAEEDRPLPDAFYCPITLGLMHKPVIDPQGYTYERLAICKWIEVNGDSPVTRARLTVDQLVPNHALEGILQAEANRESIEDIHPAILKWKKESAVSMFDIPTIASAPNNDAEIADGVVARAAPFPTTPEEFEMQLVEARRQRLQKRLCRYSLIIFLILMVVAGFFVPILAAILVVIITVMIYYAMTSSTRSDVF
jgi:hypothetical protein